jgi:hypothetical protein
MLAFASQWGPMLLMFSFRKWKLFNWEPLQTTGDRQQKEVQRSGSWQGKDKTIHLLVFSPHGFKLFLLLPLHFHTRTSGSNLMPMANQCKPNRISFHPWEATYDIFSSHHACVDSGCRRCVWRPFGSCAQSFCAPLDSSLACRTCVKPPWVGLLLHWPQMVCFFCFFAGRSAYFIVLFILRHWNTVKSPIVFFFKTNPWVALYFSLFAIDSRFA